MGQGTAAISVRDYYAGLSKSDLEKDIQEQVESRFPGARIEGHRIDGLEDFETPVVETLDLEGGRLAKKLGRMLVIEPGRVGRSLLRRSLPPPPREWPLEVGVPRESVLEVEITLPEGWGPEELPPNRRIDGDFVRARCEWSESNGRLVYRRTASLLEREIAPEDYEAFRTAIRQLNGEDKQGVVLVRK